MKFKIQLLSDQQLQCGEGPVWDSKNEKLYWTNSLGESIYSYTQQSQTSLHYNGWHAASLTLHKTGGLMTCGKEGFSLLSPQNEIHNFSNDSIGIKAYHLNDIIADSEGRVFAGQECFQEDIRYQTGHLFMLNIDGSLHIADEGFHTANGMGFSFDGKIFYVADTILRNIYQYDYNSATGAISNKKTFFHFDREDGLPDGLTIDAEGCLWVAMFLGSKIICIDPDGKIKTSIKLPFAQPTSVTFGGKDLNELFITSAALKWPTLLAPENHNFNFPRGGGLYRIHTDIQGKSEFYAGTSIIF